MHTLGDMAKALNRSPVHLAGLQKRFELPVFEGAAYSDAFVAYLREFRWSPDGRFNWNELMFEPKECIARLRMNS